MAHALARQNIGMILQLKAAKIATIHVPHVVKEELIRV
jgi:hypothetical protein